MRQGKLVLVAASIESGAFSAERVFEVAMARSNDEYVGIAPVNSCRDSERQRPAFGGRVATPSP